MNRRAWGRLLSGALVVAMTAGACGSDGDDEASPTTTQGGGAGATTSAPGGSAALEDTTPGLNPAEWKTDAKSVTGPSGFAIDLTKCPSRWKNGDGVTDSEIRLGLTSAQSGPQAAFGQIAVGQKNYFDHVNATEGGVGGKKITLLTKDDGYEAARGKQNVQELIETGNLFAFSSVLGTPIVMATYDAMNEACLPNLFSATGHPAWGDPVSHPWTTGLQLAYNTEAILWGEYILSTLGKGATVAALVMNNDFGQSYRNAFEKFAKDNGLNFVKHELHDPAAPNVQNELTTLASTNADVAILMTTSGYCTQGFNALAGSTWRPKLKLYSATCQGLNFLKPAGQNAGGWIAAGGIKDVNDPAMQNDPFVKLAREQLTKAGLDPAQSQLFNGWNFAWPMVENLKRAAQLPGGLNRTNLMLAARSFSTAHPGYLDGIKFEVNGAKDAYYVEGSQFINYDIQPGQDVGTFKPVGQPIEQNGKTPNCVWDGRLCNES